MRLNICQQVQHLQLSLYITRLLCICYHFSLAETFILAQNAAYIYIYMTPSFIELCISHCQTNIVTRLNSCQYVQLLQLSLYCTGLLPIYHHFYFGKAFILPYNDLYTTVSVIERYNCLSKTNCLEGRMSTPVIQSALQRITPAFHISIWEKHSFQLIIL
jgi:hypothetical protein